MSALIDLTGRQFSYLTVIKMVPREERKGERVLWVCDCVCGKRRVARSKSLINGDCRSCGCIRQKRPFEHLYNRFIRNRKNRKQYPIQLTYEEFFEFTKEDKCHYCQGPINWARYSHHDNESKSCSYNLDRKDNNLGYSTENCVVCCRDCNYTKGPIYTYAEFMLLSPVLKQIQEARRYKNG